MTGSFLDKEAAKIFVGEFSHKLPQQLQRIALRKLLLLDAAKNINDLRVPPGNHLEQLKGGNINRYSIRVNNQWRICFDWIENSVYYVEIIDYH